MTSEERAKYIFERAASNWQMLFPDNPNLKSFILQTAQNDIAELEMRRHELYQKTDSEYFSPYWASVKKELAKI